MVLYVKTQNKQPPQPNKNPQNKQINKKNPTKPPNGSSKEIQNKYMPIFKHKGVFTDSGKFKLSVSVSDICKVLFSLHALIWNVNVKSELYNMSPGNVSSLQ